MPLPEFSINTVSLELRNLPSNLPDSERHRALALAGCSGQGGSPLAGDGVGAPEEVQHLVAAGGASHRHRFRRDGSLKHFRGHPGHLPGSG